MMNKKEQQSLIIYLRNILMFTLLVIVFIFVLIDIWTEYQAYLYKSAILKVHIHTKQEQMVKTQAERAAEIINLGIELSGENGGVFNKELILSHLGKIRFGNENEGYIFIVSYRGITVLNDTQKDLAGRNLWELTDPDGIKVIQEERRAADIPGGDFIYYSWENPTTGRVSPKISYIIGIPELEWMVGAGLYLDDIESQLAGLKRDLLNRLVFYFLIVLAAAAGIALFVFFLHRNLLQIIENDISVFTLYFNNKMSEKKVIDESYIHFSEFSQIAVSINTMIQIQNKTEAKAVLSEKRFENLFSNIQDVIIITDKERYIIDANQPALSKQFGYTLDEIIGKNALLLFNSYADYTETGALFFDIKETTPRNKLFSTTYKKKNGELFPVEILAFQFKDFTTGKILIASINRNITERIKVQTDLKNSLGEKELLLREIHHRVKNNMAIIIAFISLQTANNEDKLVKSILESTENRIRAMALVHELLYKDTNIKTINIGEYLQILISDLLLNSGRRIKLVHSIANIDLELDTLIPLGLLVNEIVSNSIQHAYNDTIENPELSVLLSHSKNRTILRIKDNGIGIPSIKNSDETASTGIVFIKTLAEQVNGHLEILHKNGTEYTITF